MNSGRLVILMMIVLAILLLIDVGWSQNFWQPTNGPFGGSINQLAANSSNNMLFAAHDGTHGIFRSSDAGNSWTPIPLPVPSFRSSALVVNPVNSVLYAARADYVVRSTDNGESWSTSAQVPTVITTLAVSPSSASLFAGSANVGGLYRSTNDGAAWARADSGLTDTYVHSLAANRSNGDLYAGTASGGVFRSTDNGDSWRRVDSGLTNSAVIAVVINPTNGTVYAGSTDGVYRSTDNGVSWMQVNSGLTNTYVLSLAIDSSGTKLFAGTGGRVFCSTNGGDSWSDRQSNLPLTYFQALAVSGTDLFAAPISGVFRTPTNGGLWIAVNSGLVNTTPKAIVANPFNGHLFAATYYNLFRSTDNGANWFESGPAGANIDALLVSANGSIFAGDQNSAGVFRSTDDGGTWAQVNNGLTDQNVYSLGKSAIGGSYVFAGTYNGLFRSSDNGDSWIRVDSGFSNTVIRCMVSDNAHGDFFVGTQGGGIYRSTDGGNTWTGRNNGLTETWVRTLLADPVRGLIYAGTNSGFPDGGVFVSSDRGLNWIQTAALTNVDALEMNSLGHVFMSRYDGVYRSIDNGASWSPIVSGLAVGPVLTLATDANGFLYAGVEGAGVYRSVLATTSAREVTSEIPLRFSLGQNYPNPFNPATVIRFMLPVTRYTTLKIYNILGQEVATLVNEEMKPGNYEVTWDAGGIASGVYLYRLTSGPFSQTKRLLLTK